MFYHLKNIPSLLAPVRLGGLPRKPFIAHATVLMPNVVLAPYYFATRR